jgi:hypothetical protein
MPPHQETGPPPERKRGPLGAGRGSEDLVSDGDQIISYPAANKQVELSQAEASEFKPDYCAETYRAWDDPAPLDRVLP